jgi:hypothetical protein
MRRLITLISAGRNRTVMIRRELPRTRNADWAEKPYHIERWRVLLSEPLRPVTQRCRSHKPGRIKLQCWVPTNGRGHDGEDWQDQACHFLLRGKGLCASTPGPVQAERSESEGSKSLDGWRRCDTNEEEEMAGIVRPPFGRSEMWLRFGRR